MDNNFRSQFIENAVDKFYFVPSRFNILGNLVKRKSKNELKKELKEKFALNDADANSEVKE